MPWPFSSLASLYFFGTFAFLAFIGMPLQDKKKEEAVGAQWGPFAMRTSIIPFLAAIQGRNDLKWSDITWWRVLVGLALSAAFLFGHDLVTGVAVGAFFDAAFGAALRLVLPLCFFALASIALAMPPP